MKTILPLLLLSSPVLGCLGGLGGGSQSCCSAPAPSCGGAPACGGGGGSGGYAVPPVPAPAPGYVAAPVGYQGGYTAPVAGGYAAPYLGGGIGPVAGIGAGGAYADQGMAGVQQKGQQEYIGTQNVVLPPKEAYIGTANNNAGPGNAEPIPAAGAYNAIPAAPTDPQPAVVDSSSAVKIPVAPSPVVEPQPHAEVGEQYDEEYAEEQNTVNANANPETAPVAPVGTQYTEDHIAPANVAPQTVAVPEIENEASQIDHDASYGLAPETPAPEVSVPAPAVSNQEKVPTAPAQTQAPVYQPSPVKPTAPDYQPAPVQTPTPVYQPAPVQTVAPVYKNVESPAPIPTQTVEEGPEIEAPKAAEAYAPQSVAPQPISPQPIPAASTSQLDAGESYDEHPNPAPAGSDYQNEKPSSEYKNKH